MVAVSRVGVEEQLYDYAKRLGRYRSGRRAVWVRLSRLTKPYRQPSYQRAAREPFARLLRRYEGQLFTLPNQDFLCVLKGVSPSELERAVLAVEALVRDDPNLRAAEVDGRDLAFLARFYDIEQDYDSFFALAQAVAEGRDPNDCPPAAPGETPPHKKQRPTRASRSLHAPAPSATDTEAPTPDPDLLAGLLRHCQRMDIRPFLTARPVRLAGCQGAQAHIMTRLGFDLAALRAKLAPEAPAIAAGPFASAIRLTLVERLIEQDPGELAADDDRPLLVDFSAAMLLRTTGSAWLDRLAAAHSNGVIPVLDAGEILANPARLAKAAARAHARGMKLAAGDLSLALAPLFRNRKRWPLALLLFSADASSGIGEDEGRALLADLEPERLIWCPQDAGPPRPAPIRLEVAA